VPSAVSSAVVGLRERALMLEPRAGPSDRIVFGKGRVGQLMDEQLVVRSTSGQEVVRAPIQSPRGLIELGDGSLLAADRDHLYLLPAASTKIEVKPRVTLFFDSAILADRRTSSEFWVIYPSGPALYHYDLATEAGGQSGAGVGLLLFKEYVELGPKIGPGRVGATVGLKDGSFALVAGARLWRVYGSGRADPMEPPDPERPVTRLLAAQKLGEIWALRGDGKAERLALGRRMRRVGEVALDPPPFDFATSDAHLAVVHLAQRRGEAKKFSLGVYDLSGKRVLDRGLPAPSGFAGEDWVARVTRDQAVVLSQHEPLVAVGGPGRLQVWDLTTGKLVLDQ
jgi:hypothetical protein